MFAYYLHDFDPFIFHLWGNFGPRWYGMAYVLAFACGFWLLRVLAKRGYTEVRVEQVGEKADDKRGLTILYQTGNQPLAELLNFPVHSSMYDSPEVAREKQRRLLGETAKAPEETISDAPPPKVVPKAFTGRIRPAWRDGK